MTNAQWGFVDGWRDAVQDMRDGTTDWRDSTLRTWRRSVPAGKDLIPDYLAYYLAAYNTVERGYIPPSWGHNSEPMTQPERTFNPERFDLRRGGDAR